jgi:hypothetical protein
MRFQVMNVVLRFVKSLSGPPEPGSRYGRAGAGLADPAGVRLRRDRVAQVLEAVEDVHRAVLDAVLVAGDEAAADPAVVGVLAGVVEQVRARVEPLDHLLRHRAVVAQPDRAGDDEDVGGHDALEQRRPLVDGPAVLGHVRPDADGDLVVDGADLVHGHAVLAHDRGADVDQPLRVAGLGGALEGAVDEQRAQVAEVGRDLGHRLPPGFGRVVVGRWG